jgi:hypothetical protein
MKKFQKQVGPRPPNPISGGNLAAWNLDPPLELPLMRTRVAMCVDSKKEGHVLVLSVSDHTHVKMEFPPGAVIVLWERQI